MTRDHEDRHHLLAAGLLAVAALARLLPHPANITPLIAIALFGGAVLPGGLGLAVPLLAIVASDLALGLHDVVAFTLCSAVLVAIVGRLMVPRALRSGSPSATSAFALVPASLSGSTLFFLITNFGVWLAGDGGTIYPRTLHGLRDCYLAALPF